MPAVPMSSLPAGALRPALSRAPSRLRSRHTLLAASLLLLVSACTPGLRPIASGAPSPVPAPVATPAPTTDARLPEVEYLHARRLMVPVAGVEPARVADTFASPRDGGARVHRALDIMAPRGTPVLAADDGRVYRISENRLGGLTIYAIDAAERFMYYYAHLDAYREGLREGMAVARGEVIGYVGTTGNAPEHVPHLHFQAMRYRREKYWDGEPVNPKPFLAVPGRAVTTAVSANEQQEQKPSP
jgi:murein DD-endopeptidase MepM/ murein hydrolase activator NlpD